MDLDLADNGEICSVFVQACRGRRLDLMGDGDGPHPVQVITAHWRALKESLDEFVERLAEAEGSANPEGAALMNAFRRLVYDATELFDDYAILLPKRLQALSKAEKSALNDYRAAAQRLRSFCAHLCNRCKHNGAQLAMLWARSMSNGRTGTRLLVRTYSGGNALLRDDTVHHGAEAGLGLVRLGQELAHRLLRIDRAAGALIDKLGDREVEPMPGVQAALPVGNALRKLAAMRATRHADESALHDGLLFADGKVTLVRVEAESLGPHVTMTTTMTVESGTTSYSVA